MIENVPLISRTLSSPATSHALANEFDDEEFARLVREAEYAIDHGVSPQLISQGSSGSYFVRNIHEEIIGVFKPRDEEPYGELNPKWTKWFHKTCCPCCFGRGCIVANQGYLSEAGASLVDEKLELNIVPKTKVVYLGSDIFHYSKRERWQQRMKRIATEQFPDSIGKRINLGLRPKVGSFQVFVKNFKDASDYLQVFERDGLAPELEEEFQLLFEKLVILDYIIRNTDRGNNNWLVQYSPPSSQEKPVEGEESWQLIHSTVEDGSIRIAAIDNGLSFPFKHPDQWRAYPFYWSRLPWARKPFSDITAEAFLPKLEDSAFVDSLASDLRLLFKRDKNYSVEVFEKQIGVMRGQIRNLVEALQNRYSPHRLVDMPPISIQKVRESRTKRIIDKLHVRSRAPFFKDW